MKITVDGESIELSYDYINKNSLLKVAGIKRPDDYDLFWLDTQQVSNHGKSFLMPDRFPVFDGDQFITARKSTDG